MRKKKELSTSARIEQYKALNDLLQTWEKEPSEVQIKNHGYILKLRARVRNVRNYINHRKDADVLVGNGQE